MPFLFSPQYLTKIAGDRASQFQMEKYCNLYFTRHRKGGVMKFAKYSIAEMMSHSTVRRLLAVDLMPQLACAVFCVICCVCCSRITSVLYVYRKELNSFCIFVSYLVRIPLRCENCRNIQYVVMLARAFAFFFSL